MAADYQSKQKDVVLACSALKQKYRDTIDEQLPIKWVYLKAPEAEISEQLAHRVGHFANPKLLHSQLETLEEPTNAITIQVRNRPMKSTRLFRNLRLADSALLISNWALDRTRAKSGAHRDWSGDGFEWGFGDSVAGVCEVLTGGEDCNMLLDIPRDIETEVEVRIEHKLIAIVVVFVTYGSALDGERNDLWIGIHCLDGERLARNLRRLQANQGWVA